jgi:hypothetical protein
VRINWNRLDRTGLAFVAACWILITSLSCSRSNAVRSLGQVDSNLLHTKYGKPVEETFTVRPGITLNVIYGDNHQVCKLDVRPSRNDSVIPAILIEGIVNEIVPLSTRGIRRSHGLLCYGFCWKTAEYDKMRISQTADDVRPSSQTEPQSQNSLAVVQFKSCEAIKR